MPGKPTFLQDDWDALGMARIGESVARGGQSERHAHRLVRAAGSGRQKGSQNKVTRAVKDAIAAAFDELGGKDYLIEVARSDPKGVPDALEGR